MGFFSSLLGGTPPRAADPTAARRELLRVALRDTLNRHGIPPTWVGAETLVTTSRNAQKGMHWRLLIKHWDPQLLLHCVPLQQSLIKRLTTLDAKADGWLMGVSWQFALADESVCPPMPQRVWGAEPPKAAKAPLPATAAAAAPANANAKADLEQMFASRDAQLQREAAGGDAATFQRTEPAPLA